MDAELFYFFIDFGDLLLDQLDLGHEVLDLDFFSDGGDSDGVFRGLFKFFGGKRDALASAGAFKALTQDADVRGRDFSGGGEILQNLPVNNAVFGFEQAVELRENNVNALLKPVGVDVQFFFQVMMVARELPLLIKVEAVHHRDSVRLLA